MPVNPEPDQGALRRLSRHRVLRLFGDQAPTTAGKRARDSLLASLTSAALSTEPFDGDAGAALIEAAVGASMVSVDKEADRDYFVALVAAQVLSRDGQFARLSLLSRKLALRSEKYLPERPYLALTGMAISDLLNGQRSRGAQRLRAGLGLGDASAQTRADYSPVQVVDITVAAALYHWLEGGDWTLLEKASSLAVSSSESLSLSMGELALSLAKSISRADMPRVLRAASDEFESPDLTRYVESKTDRTFFKTQVAAIEEGCLEPGHTVISLPTSSGKTLLAELRIALNSVRKPGWNAIYVAPYRLLARQVEAELRVGLREVGVQVRRLGSGFEWDSFVSLDRGGAPPNVLVMTPEKLDSLMRLSSSDRSGSNLAQSYLEKLGLLIFDELQLVGRSGRGPRFEFILARLRSRYPHASIVGLCAARHGADALARWLGSDQAIAGGERPTGSIELLWRTSGELVQRTTAGSIRVKQVEIPGPAIDRAARLAVSLPSNTAPVLVLETTRPNAESVAYKMQAFGMNRSERWIADLPEEARLELSYASEMVRSSLGHDHPLADLLLDGFAFHHAGLPTDVLQEIESLVQDRRLLAIGATTTVAEGADLPFQVVVIPHLTFRGETNRLERDLYYNIVGRAGRVGVSVEGTVIVLDSDAKTLKNHVESTLWRGEEHEVIRGKLSRVSEFPSDFNEYGGYQAVQSQILAWIAEGGSQVPDQSERLATQTFSWNSLPETFQDRLLSIVDSAFYDLEDEGFVQAASPYHLTPLGARSYVAGLGPRSCKRLNDRFLQVPQQWLLELHGIREVDRAITQLIARAVLRSDESLEKTLWLRRSERTKQQRYQLFRAVCAGARDWPEGESLFEVDVTLLTKWIAGASLTELGEIAPEFDRGQFSSADAAERASDASLYVSRISYPASWTWSGIRAMAGDVGEDIPSWIRGAVEYGVPSEVAVRLITEAGVSRGAALSLSAALPERWDSAREVVLSDLPSVLSEVSITRIDAATLERLTGSDV